MKKIAKPEWLKGKIGRRFAFYVVFLGVGIAIALSLVISFQRYQNKVASLRSELDSIAISSQSFLEKSLWIMDYRSLSLVIQGFLLNNDVAFAQITDENGEVIVSDGILEPGDDIIKTIQLYHMDGGKKALIGKLTIASSRVSALKEVWSSVIANLIQSLLLMAVISIGIIYIFWHLVSKHLITIQEYTKRMTLDESQESLTLDRPVDKRPECDELASTVDAINLMCRKAIEAYRELEAQAEEKIKLEQQLLQAQKMKSIGRLAGGIAHDFNNFLSVILGYSDLLLAEMSPDNPAREKIRIMRDTGGKAATLTRQLLAFSRKQVLEKKIVSLNEIIRDFLKMLGQMVGENIVFNVRLSDSSCTIEADPGQIEQVIMNLVVNAKDAMPSGGEITIETAEMQIDKIRRDCRVQLKPGKYVLFAISDTGEGMDEEVLSKIFDPFFTTKERGKGTGLGLATVYGVVKQHGGCIRAYSEKDKGTTFEIYWPAKTKPLGDAEDKDSETGLAHGDETVLIVDDNASIRQLIVDTLNPLGYNCLTAVSGDDAVNVVRQYGGEIHLLLTDVVMPGMSGGELAEIIQKENPDVRVLLISGYAEDTIASRGVFKQGINYIPKPITPAVLAQKVASVLHGIS